MLSAPVCFQGYYWKNSATEQYRKTNKCHKERTQNPDTITPGIHSCT